MEIVIRAVVIYAAVWLLLRVMGKRELSEVTAFELVILVMLGDLAQTGVTQEDMSITGSLLAISTMSMLAVGASFVAFRFPSARRALDGTPSIVIRNGEVLTETLLLQRIAVHELLEALRKAGITDVRSVNWGIVESDGTFSFLTDSSDGAGGE